MTGIRALTYLAIAWLFAVAATAETAVMSMAATSALQWHVRIFFSQALDHGRLSPNERIGQ